MVILSVILQNAVCLNIHLDFLLFSSILSPRPTSQLYFLMYQFEYSRPRHMKLETRKAQSKV